MDAVEIIKVIYLFVVGICLGSFFNVVGLRISKGESIVHPPSSCPRCGHRIKGAELMPVLGYLFIGGKCRGCKTQISIKYPIFELLTGLLFIVGYYIIGWNLELIVALTFISLLIIISISDLEYMLIEDKVLIFFASVILIERLFINSGFNGLGLGTFFNYLIAGVLGFGILYLIAIIGKKAYKKDAMGGGDIKLYGIIGLVLGIRLTLFSVFLASLVGALTGGILIALNVVKRDQPIPFAPFIAIGSLIAYFYGDAILDWYYNLFIQM
ncbi:prepilin peptidase [Haloplasma contractile]|uniref:Type 4 prepilin-like protein leader peptide-processing enzyme n=1 Tax=Haloplasma contractile SSD-17B TaxID=1033810 RepID=U2FS72_9MOLU|nr:A24 family peptidase [Haloplasma contractile]ERJ13799.1 Type 4 prepilin-like protein leader peptide-processing enzyme [Haloplasma contractile SSD-17B]